MTVKTIVGLGTGATAGPIMFIFGLDHWLLWAFLFFASNYITCIGSIVACVPPIVMALLDATLLFLWLSYCGWAMLLSDNAPVA